MLVKRFLFVTGKADRFSNLTKVFTSWLPRGVRVRVQGIMLSFVRFFFFFNDTATTEIYTLSLHDALPISSAGGPTSPVSCGSSSSPTPCSRSEEHTSELQSQFHLVCRLLLEKKKTQY